MTRRAFSKRSSLSKLSSLATYFVTPGPHCWSSPSAARAMLAFGEEIEVAAKARKMSRSLGFILFRLEVCWKKKLIWCQQQPALLYSIVPGNRHFFGDPGIALWYSSHFSTGIVCNPEVTLILVFKQSCQSLSHYPLVNHASTRSLLLSDD